MTPVSIQPMHDRVLIKRVEAKDTTTSGLIIPESAKEKPNVGMVIAVGPGRYHKMIHPVSGLDNFVRVHGLVKPGDKVLFGKYSGQDFEYEGEKYLFALEQEILGVFES